MTGWARFKRLQKLSVPSKVFILGEYAVLSSGQALVATLPPRFELLGDRSDDSSSDGPSGESAIIKTLAELSPQSPARLLLDRVAGQSDAACFQELLADRFQELLAARFKDPHGGLGGFGGSTAEFALAYAAIHGADAPVAKVWDAYRELQPQASGADLAAQWAGGMVIADPVARRVERIPEGSNASHLFSGFFVFSAAHQPGRKVRTHEHASLLQGALQRASLETLARGEVLAEGLHAARQGDFESFARAVNEYAQLLRSMGFEHPRTTEDRAALRDVPGVCAVKGTGAMQADAVIVFGDPEQRREDLLRALKPVAQARDLRWVASGWSEGPGISV